MEEGGRGSDGGVGSTVSVHVCWPSFAGGRLVHGHLHSCAFCLRSWVCLVVRGRSFLLVGMHPHLWVLVFIYGWPALFVHVRFGIVVHRWEVGGSSWPFVV